MTNPHLQAQIDRVGGIIARHAPVLRQLAALSRVTGQPVTLANQPAEVPDHVAQALARGVDTLQRASLPAPITDL